MKLIGYLQMGVLSFGVLLGLFAVPMAEADEQGISVGELIASGDPSIFVGPILALVCVFGIWTGRNLLRFEPWARKATIVLAAAGLVFVPIGTIWGIYVIWALLWKDDTSKLFEGEGHGRGSGSASA